MSTVLPVMPLFLLLDYRYVTLRFITAEELPARLPLPFTALRYRLHCPVPRYRRYCGYRHRAVRYDYGAAFVTAA